MRNALGAAVALSLAVGLSAAPRPATVTVTRVTFNGQEYVHRWSHQGQNEFTPAGQEDLDHWTDMVTINVPQGASTPEALADLANRVLNLYQSGGHILRTDSKPRTEGHEAEHLIVGVLGDKKFLEAAFARLLMADKKQGVVVVYSHRIYGAEVGPAMSTWLEKNGAGVEKALMAWGGVPPPPALRGLPESD
jgi:hypothetical protein